MHRISCRVPVPDNPVFFITGIQPDTGFGWIPVTENIY
jgi:hypothetical protein